MDELIFEKDEQSVISVSELNKKAKSLLEKGIPKLWIEGEISNLAKPASGHMYFSLKDEMSQIRCAWFKQRQLQNTLNIVNGSKMLALGKIGLYEPRGEYQFIGCHKIHCFNRSQRNDIIISSPITHYSDRFYRQKYRKGLTGSIV